MKTIDNPRGWCTTDPAPREENSLTAGFSFQLKPRLLTVVNVIDLSATLRRITFSANDNFIDFDTVAPDDHLKLFFDKDAEGKVILPVITEGRWKTPGLTYRDYTIRWFDADARTIDVDFVLHNHGVAGVWASAASVGDQLGALGPRGSFLIKDCFDWYVFGADETALPALARWLEGLREKVPVVAYIEVANEASKIALPTRANAEIRWLYKDHAPEGQSLIYKALSQHHFADTEGFVWVAGEAGAIKPLRKLIRDLSFDRDHWDIDGYWRQGVANHDHHLDL